MSYFQRDVCFLESICKYADYFRAKTERSLHYLAQYAEVSYFQHDVCILESICKYADHFRAKTERSLYYLARCAEVSYFQHDVAFQNRSANMLTILGKKQKGVYIILRDVLE